MTVSSITLKTRMVRPLAIAGFGHYDALPAKKPAAAPFVYRLGLKIFNLARGVRLP